MKTGSDPEKTIRSVIDACSDCDTCRYLMEDSCLVFPQLYRIFDREKGSGETVDSDELRQLAEKCTLCGLCPCPNIRADIIRSKRQWVRQKGMPLDIRLLADAQRFGRLGSLAPRIVNKALAITPFRQVAIKIAGIHPDRKLPVIAQRSFFSWAHEKGLDLQTHRSPKVAYFAGCTAGYLFPEVARATVNVLQHNGIAVHVPEQQCCGMPTLLEGDEDTTLKRLRFNLEVLLKTLEGGYKVVTSCPTCGFLMKVLLKEGAFYASAYQRSVQASADEIKVPGQQAGRKGFVSLKRSIYAKILKDDRYFSKLDPLKRITLSESILDIGEFLNQMLVDNQIDTSLGNQDFRMVYFAPCHQREQEMGTPYLRMLALIPELTIQPIGTAMDCCGMGGSLGFKNNFHAASVRLARPLIEKIHAAEPEAVVTDCLSCRLQFQHLMRYPVYHPVEVLSRAYNCAGP